MTKFITTVAGNGTAGYSGDGAAATTAMLSHPRGVALDGAGNLIIADSDNDRVRKVVRRIDVLVRRGGEEFVLIMPATGATQAHATGHRIQQTLHGEPVEVEGNLRLRQTVSIGVATWDKRETPDQLERRADEAMYEAKRLGRDRVVVATPRDVVG